MILVIYLILSFIIDNHMMLENLYNLDLSADNDNICILKFVLTVMINIERKYGYEGK
jgi:hypothetical protein